MGELLGATPGGLVLLATGLVLLARYTIGTRTHSLNSWTVKALNVPLPPAPHTHTPTHSSSPTLPPHRAATASVGNNPSATSRCLRPHRARAPHLDQEPRARRRPPPSSPPSPHGPQLTRCASAPSTALAISPRTRRSGIGPRLGGRPAPYTKTCYNLRARPFRPWLPDLPVGYIETPAKREGNRPASVSRFVRYLSTLYPRLPRAAAPCITPPRYHAPTLSRVDTPTGSSLVC